MFNLYLTPLDEFMERLKENYLGYPYHTKIYYVRFADEWVIGVEGSISNKSMLAKKIQQQVRSFLWDELKLDLDKDKLTHLGREYAKFLAHYIGGPGKLSVRGSVHASQAVGLRLQRENTLLSTESHMRHTPKSSFCAPPPHAQARATDIKVNLGPTILIPLNYLKSQLILKGFADLSGYPKYVGKLLHLSDYDIVKYYNCFLTNLFIFYIMSDNRNRLSELVHILEYSLAHTLAAKHRSTLTKIFNKYGRPITVSTRDKGTVKFTKLINLKAVNVNNRYTQFNVELER